MYAYLYNLLFNYCFIPIYYCYLIIIVNTLYILRYLSIFIAAVHLSVIIYVQFIVNIIYCMLLNIIAIVYPFLCM